VAVWLIFSQVFLLHRNQGLGMFPAVKDGDLVLAYRLHREYGKGDVVVYRREDGLHLGRIAAFGNDVVMMDDSGSLTVNGNPQPGEILYPTYARENTNYPLRVQEGMLFLLGDYRTQTRDSRDFGPIPLDDIQGKVISIVRRRGI
jgi:signal peptidase I